MKNIMNKIFFSILTTIPLVFVFSCTKNLDLRVTDADNEAIIVRSVNFNDNDNNEVTAVNIEEDNNNGSGKNIEDEENNNGEENGEQELVEPKEVINHAILTSKGFALLSDDGVLSYEGYDSDNDPNWIRFADIKEDLKNIKIKNIYFNNEELNPAFAALSEDGDVFTWGKSNYGGNSSSVKELLVNVDKIVATKGGYEGGAFAALKSDGTVVSWGASSYGGNSEGVQSELFEVKEIFSTSTAFAALKRDKTVVSWGEFPSLAGCGFTEFSTLEDVETIVSNVGSFAAITGENRSVVTWGENCSGGYLSESKKSQLTQVEKILTTDFSFIAVKNDGSTVMFGNDFLDLDGDPDLVPEESIDGISSIYFNGASYIALKSDKSIVAWGNEYQGGNSAEFQALQAQNKLNNVRDIYYNTYVVFALKEDGSALTWVTDGMLGDSIENVNSTLGNLEDIKYITSSYDVDNHGAAYVAVRENGDIVVWGNNNFGGNPNYGMGNIVQPVGDLTDVKDVVATSNTSGGAFAALRNDGTVTSWGHVDYGAADTSILAYSGEMGSALAGIEKIYSSGTSAFGGTYFVGVRSNGSYIAWGRFGE